MGELRVQSHTGNPGGAVSPGVIPGFFHIPRSPTPIPTTASLVSDNGPGALPDSPKSRAPPTPLSLPVLPEHQPPTPDRLEAVTVQPCGAKERSAGAALRGLID